MTPPRLSRAAKSLSLLAVVVVALLVYSPAMDNELVSDDWVFVYESAQAESVIDLVLDSTRGWFFRPVMWVSTFFLVSIFGYEKEAFNVASLLTHFLNASLLFLLIKNLMKRWRLADGEAGSAFWFPLLGGTFFLLYPLHHETIFWYSAFTEESALSGRLACLLIVIRLLARQDRGLLSSAALVATAGFMITFALLSRESAVVLTGEIALLLLFDRWISASLSQSDHVAGHRGRERQGWTAWFVLIQSVALTSLWWIYRVAAGSGDVAGGEVAGLEVIRANPAEWAIRMTQGVVRAMTLGKVVRAPWVIGLVFISGMMVLVAAFRQRQRLFIFGALWLVLCLAPYLAISTIYDNAMETPVWQRMAGLTDDRYFYSAGAASAVVATGLALWLLREMHSRGRLRDGLTLVAFASASLLSVCIVRLHQAELQWDRAGDLLVEVREELQAEFAGPVAVGEVICVDERPDNYLGRYVLRNGIGEVLWLHAGTDDFVVLVPPYVDASVCTRHLRLGDGVQEPSSSSLSAPGRWSSARR